jgi:cellulose synthase/poly-beta-1,6-N-acetylglucosamine synthase-like glycosyltransferase
VILRQRSNPVHVRSIDTSSIATPARLLAQLDAQAGDVGARVDVTVCYNDDEVDGHELEHLLQRHLTIQWKLAAARGCEYYELKTRAASLSKGDPVAFVDSDVIPEPEWLAELLACFDDPAVEVACGSTFIDPESLSGKAFALFCSFRSVRYAEKSAGCRSSTPTTWPFAAGRSSAFRSRTSWTRRGAPACSLRSV